MQENFPFPFYQIIAQIHYHLQPLMAALDEGVVRLGQVMEGVGGGSLRRAYDTVIVFYVLVLRDNAILIANHHWNMRQLVPTIGSSLYATKDIAASTPTPTAHALTCPNHPYFSCSFMVVPTPTPTPLPSLVLSNDLTLRASRSPLPRQLHTLLTNEMVTAMVVLGTAMTIFLLVLSFPEWFRDSAPGAHRLPPDDHDLNVGRHAAVLLPIAPAQGRPRPHAPTPAVDTAPASPRLPPRPQLAALAPSPRGSPQTVNPPFRSLPSVPRRPHRPRAPPPHHESAEKYMLRAPRDPRHVSAPCPPSPTLELRARLRVRQRNASETPSLTVLRNARRLLRLAGRKLPEPDDRTARERASTGRAYALRLLAGGVEELLNDARALVDFQAELGLKRHAAPRDAVLDALVSILAHVQDLLAPVPSVTMENEGREGAKGQENSPLSERARGKRRQL
ncbi:hypothetical protein C8R43DRAFT_1018992 [Mycena crocata]|nr:hypothetical protein C8R43DRAFT_1018992 [Mycena crocata]